MKWIKASERVPEDWEKINVRLISDKTLIHSFVDSEGVCFSGVFEGKLCYINIDLIEWLDETPQQIEIGVDHFPHRPYFKIGNQTFFIDTDEPENYEWYCEQMKKAFESGGLEVKHEVV